MINREKIREIVGIFYQSTFKTFYINSLNGNTFVKPFGVFVSLGMTTSLDSLNYVKNAIISTSGLSAEIAEISSEKTGDQYINTLTKLNISEQYEISKAPENTYTKEEAEELLTNLKEKLTTNITLDEVRKLSVRISKLSEQINKLTEKDNWENHLIQETNDDFKIFHQFVNYRKENNIEYRIGIYVTD